MLTSSKLVLQAHLRASSSEISDSEDSKGYLSEGETYRRSRFPRSSKPPADILSSNEWSSKEKNAKTIYSSDVNISGKSPHLMYESVFLKKREKGRNNDTVPEVKANEVENSCPFYFSPLHRNDKKSNIIGNADDEDESHPAGNPIHDMVT